MGQDGYKDNDDDVWPGRAKERQRWLKVCFGNATWPAQFPLLLLPWRPVRMMTDALGWRQVIHRGSFSPIVFDQSFVRSPKIGGGG